MPAAAPGHRATDRISFGRFTVDPGARQLLADGRAAKLGARAFDLLQALIERRDRMVSKSELLDLVWPGLVVEENNLQVQVSALRRLLGPTAISTVPGRGYRFTAPLSVEGEGGEPASPGSPVPPLQAAPQVERQPSPPSAGPGNLPLELSPLIGREDDLRALQACLEAHALVTLVGASGMGKTVLAQAVARALRARWRDGAWFVELAPVTDPSQVVSTVAQALHVALPPGRPSRQHLVNVLGSMSLLLVLDNCEHVVDAVAELAEAIGSSAPGVRLLATSQELLNVTGETLFKLNPLAVPVAREWGEAGEAGRAGGDPEEALQYGAVRLFVERARADDRSFVLSAQNAAAVADICRRLDGLPLAIELAAARVRLLGVGGLLQRLSERFRVLTGGARTAMRRHQTLHAAIDWSHGLLSGAEQVVFRRLGVFVGGFTLELAQQVVRDEPPGDPVGRTPPSALDPPHGPPADPPHDQPLDDWAVLDALGALVDKSLVVAQTTDPAAPPRYRLLETTRAYALERLADAGETEAWLERHARAVCELFERSEEARMGEHCTLSNVQFTRGLAPELDNARAALDWADGEARGTGALNLAVGLACTAGRVSMNLGLSAEALDRLASLRPRIDASVDAPRAARFWALLAELGSAGRLPLAATLDAADRAEHLYAELDAPRRRYFALLTKGMLLASTGDWSKAQALLPQIERLEDPAWPAWPRNRLGLLGLIHDAQGQFEQALAVHQRQRSLYQHATGERWGLILAEARVCWSLNMTQRHEDCISLARSVIERETGGAASGGVALVFLQWVRALTFAGRLEEARRAVGQALPMWRREGIVFTASLALAHLAAACGHWADATRLQAASNAFLRRLGMESMPAFVMLATRVGELLAAAPCKAAEIERWQQEGEALDEAGIAAICSEDGESGGGLS